MSQRLETQQYYLWRFYIPYVAPLDVFSSTTRSTTLNLPAGINPEKMQSFISIPYFPMTRLVRLNREGVEFIPLDYGLYELNNKGSIIFLDENQQFPTYGWKVLGLPRRKCRQFFVVKNPDKTTIGDIYIRDLSTPQDVSKAAEEEFFQDPYSFYCLGFRYRDHGMAEEYENLQLLLSVSHLPSDSAKLFKECLRKGFQAAKPFPS